MKRIYIHDACVLIDLIEGDLLQAWFQLGFETYTSHLVYQEVLRDEQSPQLQYCIDNKMLILETIEADIIPKLTAEAESWRVSLPDASVAYLAKKHHGILLSGDKRLRARATANGIEIKGILWVLDTLIENHIIPPQQALTALDNIISAGSRMPTNEVDERRKKWKM